VTSTASLVQSNDHKGSPQGEQKGGKILLKKKWPTTC